MVTKYCKECSQPFLTRRDRGIYCSRKCRGLSERTRYEAECLICKKPFTTVPAEAGQYCSRSCSAIFLREKYKFGGAANWKGEAVSYRNLHRWVEKWKGKPMFCEHCGKSGGEKRYHWANLSKKYIRDLDDWIRLCPKCHKHFDS